MLSTLSHFFPNLEQSNNLTRLRNIFNRRDFCKYNIWASLKEAGESFVPNLRYIPSRMHKMLRIFLLSFKMSNGK